jgi:hypothetical protein
LGPNYVALALADGAELDRDLGGGAAARPRMGQLVSKWDDSAGPST